MQTATEIEMPVEARGKFRGVARLFELNPPLADKYAGSGSHSHVVVSAVNVAFDTGKPETYIFPADNTGKIKNWGELEGSFRGAADIPKALRNAGYTIV